MDWTSYLDDFHTTHAGHTEDVLERCTADGLTPYGWVLRAVTGRARRVLDVACGSAAVAGRVRAERVGVVGAAAGPFVVGIDRSAAELAVARKRHHAAVVRADATALPFAAGTFDAAVWSMALMVVQPLDVALAECARVVRPGGLLAGTVASPVPLRPTDLLVLGPLTARLRTPPQFPAGGEMPGLAAALNRAGFDVLEDARERFGFRVRGDRADDDARLLLDTLYLPDVPDSRRAAATGWLADRARTAGVEVAIPIRRVVAMRR